MMRTLSAAGLVYYSALTACGSNGIGEIDFGHPIDAGAADADAAVASCDDLHIERCQVGRCILSAPRTTLQEGEVVALTELSAGDLVQDVLPGTGLCVIGLPARLEGAVEALTLSLVADPDPAIDPADTTLFVLADGIATRAAASSGTGATVSGLVQASGTYGATRRPGAPVVETTLVSDPQRSDTPEARIRNVTASSIRTATFDGTYTYLGSGSRVLGYVGMPLPGQAPSFVLGQPDLDHVLPGASASLFSEANDVWSDGTRLAVAGGNRVLTYASRPTTSFAPADNVLGQQDFVTTTANTGGTSASSMFYPYEIASDGTRLLVSDRLNNRVLSWSTFPTRIGQPATGVIGQPTFTSNGSELGASPIYQATGVALDGQGAWLTSYFGPAFRVSDALALDPVTEVRPLTPRPSAVATATYTPTSLAVLPSGALAIADNGLARVAWYDEKPTSSRPVDFALGQADVQRTTVHPVSASSVALIAPTLVRSAAPYFFVADTNRILVYEHTPAYFFDPADRVLGQAGFTTRESGLDTRFVSSRALGFPAAVATHAGTLVVADRGNNRVLVFGPSDLALADPAASVVLGQADDHAVVPNGDQVSVTASTLSGPAAVAFAGNRLVVADTENHRVLVWNTVPTTTGAPADLVLGQSSFAARRPNRGRGDSDGDHRSDATLDGFFAPSGLASDGIRLFVTDRIQHRVLVWDSFPTQSGQPADRVLGQDDPTGVLANRGHGVFQVQGDGLAFPTALALDGTSLFVADTENNRVLRWDGVDAAPMLGAVYGQADGSTVANPNMVGEAASNSGLLTAATTTATSIVRPVGLTVAGNRIYVSEAGGNRVHAFDRDTRASVGCFGQSQPDRSTENADGLGARSLAGPAGLASDGNVVWIADGNNHRVVGVPRATFETTGGTATRRVGQPSWVQNGYSRGYPASAGGTPRPTGVAITSASLYVVEQSYHRVVVYDRTDLGAGFVQRVLGQSDGTSILANGGDVTSSHGLSSPRGISVRDDLVFVADTGNHRVLVFDGTHADAILVLGQADGSSHAGNRGGAAGPATLAAPEAVFYDGARVYVADTGNHRVLVWNTLPTQSGSPADVVIGQTDFTGALQNQGAATPTAASLALPNGLFADASGVFVSDSQNNRVLRFDAPYSNTQAASRVLGQPDAQTRTPAGRADDLQHAAGPVALTSDGTHLFVGDRDARRVLVFAKEGTSSVARGTLALPGDVALGAPVGLAIERTALFTSRLVVTDSSQNRVLIVGGNSRLRER